MNQYTDLHDIARGHLHEIGYADDSITNDLGVLVAHWGIPSDKFRSAVAVAVGSGLDPKALMSDYACHVVVVGQDHAELWTLGADAPERRSRVDSTSDGLAALFAEAKSSLTPQVVAETKLRMRRCVLHGGSPTGDRCGAWVVDHEIKRLAEALEDAAELVASSGDFYEERLRWLIRVVAILVGADRGWGTTPPHWSTGVTVGDFVKSAESYPMKREWHRRADSDFRHMLAKVVMHHTRDRDFSTIDTMTVIKAVDTALIRQRRKPIWSPTPAMWDMLDSIPVDENGGVCDAAVESGAFLLAAGHRVTASSSERELIDLRRVLHGVAESSFMFDSTSAALDLAFGYKPEGWKLGRSWPEFNSDRQWTLIGRPSSRRIDDGVSFLDQCLNARLPAGGNIAAIVPHAAWNSPKCSRLRERIASEFTLESAWCHPFDGRMNGGEDMGLFVTRGKEPNAAVWKQTDGSGVVGTIGYGVPSSDSLSCVAPHVRYLHEQTEHCRRLGDLMNISHGVKLVSRKRLSEAPSTGDVPFIHIEDQLLEPNSMEVISRCEAKGLPISLKRADAENWDGWTRKNSARSSGSVLYQLDDQPQLAIHRRPDRDASGLTCWMTTTPALFGEAFRVMSPKESMSEDYARGVAIILTSLFGRFWLHVHGSTGDPTNNALADFPLPSELVVIELGRERNRFGLKNWLSWFTPRDIPSSAEPDEQRIFGIYGIDESASATLLAIARRLEFDVWSSRHGSRGDKRLVVNGDGFRISAAAA